MKKNNLIEKSKTSGKNITTKEKSSKEKRLFECESIVDADEFKRMVKYFPFIYWKYVKIGTLINLIATAIFAIIEKNIASTLAFFTIIELFILIVYKVRLEKNAEKSFYYLLKKTNNKNNEKDYHLDFYECYFIWKDESISYKIKYLEIEECIETDTNFYLYYKGKKKLIIIQKKHCSFELINFIREKFINVVNNTYNNKFKINQISCQKKMLINKLLMSLFILTICSFILAFIINLYLCMKNFNHGNLNKNAWVFWCFLIVPILSIIMGLKFKKTECSYKKNIVVGIIVLSLMLIFGYNSINYDSPDYDNYIKNYEEIFDVNLPKKGAISIGGAQTVDNNKSKYEMLIADYSLQAGKELTKNISKNDKWILSTNLKDEFEDIIPSIFHIDKDSYILIYNKTTNEYNQLPKESGSYRIYITRYDPVGRSLTVHTFKYDYKKENI